MRCDYRKVLAEYHPLTAVHPEFPLAAADLTLAYRLETHDINVAPDANANRRERNPGCHYFLKAWQNHEKEWRFRSAEEVSDYLGSTIGHPSWDEIGREETGEKYWYFQKGIVQVTFENEFVPF